MKYPQWLHLKGCHECDDDVEQELISLHDEDGDDDDEEL